MVRLCVRNFEADLEVLPGVAVADHLHLSASRNVSSAFCGEGAHVGLTVGAAGAQHQRALHRAGDGDAGVAGGIAVAVAAGAGRARLGDAPGGAMALAYRARAERRVGLARRADAGGDHLLVADAEQRLARLACVDHRAAEKIRGGAGHGEQRGGDEPAGRGLRDGDRLAALLQAGADGLGKRYQALHRAILTL